MYEVFLSWVDVYDTCERPIGWSSSAWQQHHPRQHCNLHLLYEYSNTPYSNAPRNSERGFSKDANVSVKRLTDTTDENHVRKWGACLSKNDQASMLSSSGELTGVRGRLFRQASTSVSTVVNSSNVSLTGDTTRFKCFFHAFQSRFPYASKMRRPLWNVFPLDTVRAAKLWDYTLGDMTW